MAGGLIDGGTCVGVGDAAGRWVAPGEGGVVGLPAELVAVGAAVLADPPQAVDSRKTVAIAKTRPTRPIGEPLNPRT
jgi:hypothetical protein